jgi:hypothetical protein
MNGNIHDLKSLTLFSAVGMATEPPTAGSLQPAKLPNVKAFSPLFSASLF